MMNGTPETKCFCTKSQPLVFLQPKKQVFTLIGTNFLLKMFSTPFLSFVNIYILSNSIVWNTEEVEIEILKQINSVSTTCPQFGRLQSDRKWSVSLNPHHNLSVPKSFHRKVEASHQHHRSDVLQSATRESRRSPLCAQKLPVESRKKKKQRRREQ